MTHATLYISAYLDSSNSFWIDTESLIVLFVYKIARADEVKLIIQSLLDRPVEALIKVSSEGLNYNIHSTIPDIAKFVVWPAIVSANQVTAGVCSVTRSLIKRSPNPDIRNLLGFREACLFSCSETSIWTRFCEVDIVQTIKSILVNNCCIGDEFHLPSDIVRFEYHLSTPVRIHNIYKVARVKNKDKGIKSGIPTEELNIQHIFSEGPFMTLADVILYQCYEVFFKNCPLDLIKRRIPLTLSWFKRMEESALSNHKFIITNNNIQAKNIFEPDFVRQSLYTADPSRHKPEKRIFTKQTDIDVAFDLLQPIKYDIVNEETPFGKEIDFNWLDVPLEANPNGGALPKSRADRKCEQLENLAKAVMKIAAQKKYSIVDFCSGSGHLGILLATLLPNCEIVLVENKERSLLRAKERIEKLGLTNVFIVQSNLDYFQGNFDIGVALHACGVATDLVIQNCINKKAHLVVCPCCYGGVRNCHHLTYPRSNQFKKLDLGLQNYLNLAHAADQTHDKENVKTEQGYFCMNAVDTDRRMYIESFGYKVHLGKLYPTSCTNKNNLLVGLTKDSL
ncbi:unnamed protein product [Diabrotica balteata]|uniref:Methyltransferase domain-containing protein n=1 Tax=Diabrotica balteata TaxID=107213 RepID=A0A9N9X791_DIABA|nr:unnamed protein product [Diabrotica balteata]